MKEIPGISPRKIRLGCETRFPKPLNYLRPKLWQKNDENVLSSDCQGRLCLFTSQMAHQAGAYPSFCSMKRLGVFLLPPGWDASPSQGYPPAFNSWREVLFRNTTQCSNQDCSLRSPAHSRLPHTD